MADDGLDAWLTAFDEQGAREGAERALGWLGANGYVIGITDARYSACAHLRRGSERVWPFFVTPSENKLSLALQYLRFSSPFDVQAERRRLITLFYELNAPGFRWSGNLEGFPSFQPVGLLNERVFEGFTSFAARLRDEVAAHPPGLGLRNPPRVSRDPASPPPAGGAR